MYKKLQQNEAIIVKAKKGSFIIIITEEDEYDGKINNSINKNNFVLYQLMHFLCYYQLAFPNMFRRLMSPSSEVTYSEYHSISIWFITSCGLHKK
jgi:hypothetical protein